MIIVCGVDAHDKKLVGRTWRSDKVEKTRRFRNTYSDRGMVWEYLHKLRNEGSRRQIERICSTRSTMKRAVRAKSMPSGFVGEGEEEVGFPAPAFA